MKRYLLAHDLGTSGNKAVLFDTEKKTISSDYTSEYQTLYPERGFVEHEPDEWWKAVCRSTRILLKESGISASQIAGISFSAIMNSCLPVDASGHALRNAMIWADQRGIDHLERLYSFASGDEFYRITGHRINGTYALTKMLWLQAHEPDIFKKTHKFLQAKDYIIHKLTGEFATDYSDASHLGLMDQGKKCYWTQLLDHLGIPLGKLPDLHKSTDIIGFVTASAASQTGLEEGTPVIMGGGDGCCATAGAGVYKEGTGYNVLGTSSWNGTISKKMIVDEKKITFSFIHVDGIHHAVLGTMQSAGHSLDWAVKSLYPTYTENRNNSYKTADKEVLKLYESHENPRLIYLPYLLGERSPWWNSEARGCYVGLEASTTPAHMVKATLEGVGYNLKLILDALESNVGELEMRVIGGGAKSEIWLKILASIWNKKIAVPKYVGQATSLGAVMCAGVGIGAFSGFSDIDDINPVQKIIEPDPVMTTLYRRVFPVFSKTYEALVPVFHALQEV